MTPKEKAEELVNKYLYGKPLSYTSGHYDCMDFGKECALVSITDKIDYIENEMIGINYDIRKIFIDELKEIKKEIELL